MKRTLLLDICAIAFFYFIASYYAWYVVLALGAVMAILIYKIME